MIRWHYFATQMKISIFHKEFFFYHQSEQLNWHQQFNGLLLQTINSKKSRKFKPFKSQSKANGTPEKKSKKAYLLFTTKLQPFRAGKNKNWHCFVCFIDIKVFLDCSLLDLITLHDLLFKNSRSWKKEKNV